MMDRDLKHGLAFFVGYVLMLVGIGYQMGWPSAMIFAGAVICALVIVGVVPET